MRARKRKIAGTNGTDGTDGTDGTTGTEKSRMSRMSRMSRVPEGWKMVKLGEVCDTCLGKMLDAKKNKGEYQSYLNNIAVRWGAFDLEGLPKMRFEAEEKERYSVRKGDIVVCEGGEPGRCAIWKNEEPIYFQKALHRVRAKDGVANDYIYYAFRNLVVTGITKSFETGSTIRHLPGQELKQIPIPLPPLPTQRKIAAVLGAIDDKIENNRKICVNLEAQAQALFKSWFVDFEPFGGKMPEGWKMGKLGDVAEITMGQSPDGKSLNDIGEGVTFFQGRAEFGSRYPTKRLSTTEPKRMANKGDVLLSVRAPVGDLNIALEDCCIGRGLSAIRSKSKAQSFVYYLLKSKKDVFDLYEGSGTIFGSINKDALHELHVISPNENDLHNFEKIVAPFDSLYCEKELESRTLAALRDALLPRLMSGEIDVSEVAV